MLKATLWWVNQFQLNGLLKSWQDKHKPFTGQKTNSALNFTVKRMTTNHLWQNSLFAVLLVLSFKPILIENKKWSYSLIVKRHVSWKMTFKVYFFHKVRCMKLLVPLVKIIHNIRFHYVSLNWSEDAFISPKLFFDIRIFKVYLQKRN